jgi:hypothetical protein
MLFGLVFFGFLRHSLTLGGCMSCFSPRFGFRYSDGTLGFVPYKRGHAVMAQNVQLRCGKCEGCLEDYARGWALRIGHEAREYSEASMMATLTYDDVHLSSPSLSKADFQLFMKRLRKRLIRDWRLAGKVGPEPRVRYFCGAEYGSKSGRPHFHCIFFGWIPVDRVELLRNKSGPVFRSALLTSCWSQGIVEFVGFNDAVGSYVAQYCLKKQLGKEYAVVDASTGEWTAAVPEFCLMSRRPGIGAKWFEKYSRDCIWPEASSGRDGVLCGDVRVPLPAYYNKLALRKFGERQMDKVIERRLLEAKEDAKHRTPQVLAARRSSLLARRRSRSQRGL